MSKSRILFTDGRTEPIEPQDKDNGFTFNEIKKALGFPDDYLIQIVPIHRTGEILICDEEGMFNNHKINLLATGQYGDDVNLGPDGIMGNVIVCPSEMVQ
jgi:hypothetical protein